MRRHTGWVKELRSEVSGQVSAHIACPQAAVPSPGCYLSASSEDEILDAPLFLQARLGDGFLAASPVPRHWEPGTELILRGPIGNGFSLPADASRLTLAALELTISRLLPLAEEALRRGMAVALFSDVSYPALPPAVEASPLAALPEAIAWADFLVVDLALEALPKLGERLGLNGKQRLSCPGQALVLSAMPCAGIAECGVCALKTGRGWKLACKDGPVFALSEIVEHDGYPGIFRASRR